MKLRPIPASEFVTYAPEYKDLIQQCGGVAVNDKLLELWEDQYDIALLFGGRGGGKSEGLVDKLLDECLTEKYFKCYYGRKVFDTVRGSQFETLVASIKKNHLEHEFSFSEAENSSMIITCKRNRNRFIPFGSDKADKLKSIKDPTHLWCEEFDQFKFADFQALLPTIRTIRGKNVFIASFNTWEVLPNHWILKVFFPNLYDGDDKDDVKNVDLLKKKKVKKIFINYTDNYFINQSEYEDNLLLSSGGNLSIYDGLANGAWGVMINDSPWLFAWERSKHVAKEELHASRLTELYLSFDFNRNPAACVVMQWPGRAKLQIIDVIKKNNTGTEGICEILLLKYPPSQYVYIITGDQTGDTDKQAMLKEYTTNYTIIKRMLNLSKNQIQLTVNPPLKSNKTLVNAVFFRYPIEVCPVKARPFIFDAENVKARADGTIVKDDRDDPAQQADVLDCVRYWINKFMFWFLKA